MPSKVSLAKKERNKLATKAYAEARLGCPKASAYYAREASQFHTLSRSQANMLNSMNQRHYASENMMPDDVWIYWGHRYKADVPLEDQHRNARHL
jgi:hypothetical protein